MIKYKACHFYYSDPEIKKVKIDRETDGTVYFGGIVERKDTKHYKYFDSFGEAKEHLKSMFYSKLIDAEVKVVSLKRYLSEVEAMEE